MAPRVCNGNLAVFTKDAPFRVRGPKTTLAPAQDATTAASNVTHSIAALRLQLPIGPKKTQAGFTVNLVGAVYPFEKY